MFEWIEDAGKTLKSIGDGVGGYVKFCGQNIADGWSTVGDYFSMAGDDFKSGAWVGGLGNGLMGTLSILGAAGNTVLGGNLKAAGDYIFDNSVDFKYEDGTAHLVAQEDNGFLGNLAANTLGKFVETGVNAELEMDEAIQEGDIDKANKMGGIILAEGASIPAIAFATVCGGHAIAAGASATAAGIGGAVSAGTLSAGTIATSVGTGIGATMSAGGVAMGASSLATWGLGNINDKNHTVLMIETPKDYYSDNADAVVQRMIDAGYIDANDESSIASFKEATMTHLSGADGGDNDIYRNMIIMAQDQGDLTISKDFFADMRRDDAEFKETAMKNLEEFGVDLSKLSDEQKDNYFESVVNSYASYDAGEIDFNTLKKELTTDNNVMNYEIAGEGQISQEDMKFYAELDTQLMYGDITEKGYYKQILTRSLSESTGLSDDQIDAYSDYMADVNLGEITQEEAVELMAKDPDLSNLFDKDGNLVLPAKTEEQIQAQNQTQNQSEKSDELVKPSGMPEADWVKYKAYLESKKDEQPSATTVENTTTVDNTTQKTDNSEKAEEKTEKEVPAGAVEIINSDWSSKYGDKFGAIVNTINATIIKYAPDMADKVMSFEADFIKSHDLQFSVAEKDVAELSKDDIVAALKDDAQDILDAKEPVTEAPSVADQGLAFE